MKTHRLILFFCFSLVFFPEQVFSADFPGSKTVVAYVQPNQGNPYYAYGAFGIDIGYKYVSEAGESETARTKFTFDLTTIPPNAEITSVQLSYNVYNYANGSYKFKLTQIGNYNSPQEIWQNIGQATSLFTDVAFASGSLNSGTLTSLVNSSKGSYLYIGALSQNENNSDSRANLDLTLNVQFSVPPATVNITADNNFTASGGSNHGTMVIDGVNRTIPLAGYTFQKTVGQTLTLSANSPQDDNQGHQRIWHTGSINRSRWERNGDFKSYDQTYSSPVAEDDNGKIYMANLRKNFKIDQTHKFEFDVNQTQQNTAWIVEQNSGNISTQSSRLINGRNYLFAGWEDNLTLSTTRNISAADNQTYNVLYKYPHHSNSTSAYSSNSQRKFVQTPDGVKHMVYESMNKVWYELSTDNGATWSIGNGGKPLSNADSKNPSMSFYGNQIGIVWQEKSGSSFIIKLALFWMSDYSSSLFSTVAAADFALNYTYNASPVITWGYNGKVVVVWSGFDLCAFPVGSISLKYAYGSASSNSVDWIAQCGIDGTNENSINPTIIADYTDDISNPFNYHLAWEQVINTSNSKVNYCRLFYQNNNIQHSAIEEASLNSGYNKNYKPLLTLRQAFGFEYIYLSWLGYRQFVSEGAGLEKSNFDQTGETRALLRYKLGANWSAIGVYGNSVASQSLNRGTTVISRQQIMGFAWSEYNGLSFVNKMMKLPVSQNIFTLNTTGKDLQVNNSVSFSDMFANSYQTVSSPFSFNLSQNFNSLNKENVLMVYNGREGVVGRNDGQFYFALGDITVNGTNINFPQIPDSIIISTLAELNHYLTSESFNVDNNSSLVYGVQYGITDTLSCISALEDEREINFKVELFDPMSNDILGVFDNVTFNENNVIQYENIGYQVDLTGIGNRTLKLRLVVDYSPDFSFNLSDRYADESILAKNNLRTINYRGSLAVTEYALEQNYPNPFNPSTTIRYQLPQDGRVTLKVYDILGSEVATLVNEEKPAGRYEVNFNASSLASGVYIYKITSGSYVSSKKMLLVK